MHTNPNTDIPPVIRDNPLLDFYLFQSGHGGNETDLPIRLAEKFVNYSVKRPVVNGEPCYEGHAYGWKYPRWSAFEVRQALWQSLLSGAKAGFTYGAHGIWMFQHKGMTFMHPEFSGLPFLWREALQFEGAWDVSWAKWLIENYNFSVLEPHQDLVDGPEQIRAASSPDRSLIALYIPYAAKITIRHDLGAYKTYLHLLDKHRVVSPELVIDGDFSVLPMIGYNTDALFVAQRMRR
jgi:hypothetical protein